MLAGLTAKRPQSTGPFGISSRIWISAVCEARKTTVTTKKGKGEQDEVRQCSTRCARESTRVSICPDVEEAHLRHGNIFGCQPSSDTVTSNADSAWWASR